MTPDDRRYLGMTFDLARAGLGATNPNPAVGALVVRGGGIVGRGYHAKAGEDHAETIALAQASDSARGADLYVNLEPCCHHRLLHGRAAPCVEQILASGVRRVVAAAKDPNPMMNGRGLARLEAEGVLIEPFDPAFERRAGRFNEVFFKFITTGRPFVVLKAGMTIDGRIALASGDSRWITSQGARAEARELRSLYDAVLVGSGTVLADDPLLLPRSAGPAPVETRTGAGPAFGRIPLRVVLDARLRISPSSRLAVTASEGPVLVYTSQDAPDAAERALQSRGVEIVRKGEGRPPLEFVLEDLARRGISSVLVEGGGETLGAFLRGGHADKAVIFVAPSIFGGTDARPAFGGEAPSSLEAAVRLIDLTLRAAGDGYVIEGYPARPPREDVRE